MVQISKEIKDIFNILSMTVETESDLFSVLVPRDLLLRVDIEQKLTELISNLKGKYKTSKLNCLHKNRDSKQKFPGINLVRQILRCNGYHLKPVIYCRGYCKHSGKKIVDRNFKVIRLKNYTEIKEAPLENDEMEVFGLGILNTFKNCDEIENDTYSPISLENEEQNDIKIEIEELTDFPTIQNDEDDYNDQSYNHQNKLESSNLVQLNF